MITRFVALAALLAGLMGCSSKPALKSDPVDVTVTVVLPNGQPGADLTLMLLPTGANQSQAGGKTDAKGKVATKLYPGKYGVAFDNQPANVPRKYHSNEPANAVEVTSDMKELTIKLTN